MRPPSQASAPEMQLMSVVFPEPLGPIRPKRSPALTWSDTRSSAVNPPKRLVNPSTSSRAPVISSPPETLHEADQPLGSQHHEGYQHDAHDEQVEFGGDGHRGHLLCRSQEDGADDRAHPRGGAAD